MLSAIVITRNEEDSIASCLASLSFADQVVVVDSGSTDNTVSVARQRGAQVYTHAWSSYGDQKNFGASKALGQWLLFIDADEQVSPALATTITALVGNTAAAPPHDFYWLRIITVFLNRPLPHLFGNNVRLFKKSAGQWDTAPVHEQVLTATDQTIKLGDQWSGRLFPPLFHYSHRTVTSYLTKMYHYTTLDARHMFRTQRHRSGKKYYPSVFLPYRLFVRQLVKLLFYRRGFMDGLAGCLWCVLSAYYEFDMAKKYNRLSRTPPQYPLQAAAPDQPAEKAD